MKYKILTGTALIFILTGFSALAEAMTSYQATSLEMNACLEGGQKAHDDEQILRTSAELGDVWAQEALAVYLQNRGGVCKNKVPSFKEAILYHRKAADAGLPEAAMSLGDMYMNGEGVHRNTAEAAQWYKKAALGISRQVPDGFFSQPSLSQVDASPDTEGRLYNSPPQSGVNEVVPSQYAQAPTQAQPTQSPPTDPCSQEGTWKIIQTMREQNPNVSGAAINAAVNRVHQMFMCGGGR
jgi:hypothetical protein